MTVTEDMERWCARPYPYNHLGSTFQPLVIGPSAIPRITDVEALLSSQQWPAD